MDEVKTMKQDESSSPESQSSALSPQSYLIGGQRYRLEPASYRQHRWLAQGPLKGIDLGAGMSGPDLQTIIQQHGPEILGIVLVPEGQTRDEKVRAGLKAAQDLGEAIDCGMSPEEVRPIAEDFFVVNGWANLAYFIDFRAAAARMPETATASGSTPASASSPAATSPGVTASSADAGQETASPISAGGSSSS